MYTSVRDKDFRQARQKGEIKLTDAQYTEIAARASQTKTAEQIQAGEYWMNQFAAIRKELERQNRRWDKLKPQLHKHKVWDDYVAARLLECDITVDSAPSLEIPEDDEIEEEQDGTDKTPNS
jgi:hypothetical protein